MSKIAFKVGSGVTLSWLVLAQTFSSQALASQGPGIAPGTASPTVQLAMAIAVYGASAVLLIVGLIGSLRHA